MGPITLECDDLACALGSTSPGALDALTLRHGTSGWVPILLDPGCAALPDRIGASELIVPDGSPAGSTGWRILDRSPGSARFVREFGSGSTRMGAVQRVELSPGRVTIDQSVTNLGDSPTPCWMARRFRVPRVLLSTSDTLDVGRDGEGASCSWVRSGITLHLDHSGALEPVGFEEPESGVGTAGESMYVEITMSTIDPRVLGSGSEREHAPDLGPGETLSATIALSVTSGRAVSP